MSETPIHAKLPNGAVEGTMWMLDDLEPWERCGCPACHATMDALYGSDDEQIVLPQADPQRRSRPNPEAGPDV